MQFNDFDLHKTFGRFTATIEVLDDGGCSRADVWLNGNSVNLACVEDGIHSGLPEEDFIVDAVYREGLRNEIVDWAYGTDLY
jgi:hypothetical protein